MLVVQVLEAPPRRRRRRRPREAREDRVPPLALSRATAVLTERPFADEEEANGWLRTAVDSEEVMDALLETGVATLNRALAAQAIAAEDPRLLERGAVEAAAARIGYGSGEEVAAGRFRTAFEVDAAATGVSRRRRREQELRPQERLAALLAGRESPDACELPLLRARADLDAGRAREAALQLAAGLEALLVELPPESGDAEHAGDVEALAAARETAAAAAREAAAGPLEPTSVDGVGEVLERCERVLRRRRVLRGG